MVRSSAREAVRERGRWAGRLSVAAVNSPAATVVPASRGRGRGAEFEAELSAVRVLRGRLPASDFVATRRRARKY